MGDRDLEAIQGKLHLLGGVFDDTLVGLVRHDERHVVDGQAGALEHLVDGVAQRLDRELEHLLAVHVQRLARTALGDCLGHAELLVDARQAGINLFHRVEVDAVLIERLRRVERRGARQRVGIVIVVADERAQDAGAVGIPLDHGGAGAIAEQHARVAIGPVGDAGQALAAHDERAAERGAARSPLGAFRGRGHHGLRDGQTVDEAGAGGVHVERDGVDQAQPAAQQRGARRDHHVRRRGGEDDKIDLLGIDAALVVVARLPAERAARGRLGEIDVGLIDADAARLDAGARGDPLVAGVDQRGQIVIGDLERGQRLSATDDRTTHIVHSPVPSASNHRMQGAELTRSAIDSIANWGKECQRQPGSARASALICRRAPSATTATRGGPQAPRRRRRRASPDRAR